MTFSEFAQIIYVYRGNGAIYSDFILAMLEAIIMDTDDELVLHDKTPDYISRIYSGSKPLPKNVASFVLANLDKEKFIDYLSDLSDDAKDNLRKELIGRNVTCANKNEVAEKCAETFETILTDQANSSRQRNAQQSTVSDPFEDLKKVQALLDSIPAPQTIAPPPQPLPEEHPYITALYAAYGDREGVTDFDESQLALFDEYDDDIKERRIDYFSAETIRRGVTEIYSGQYANQFDVLKEETYDGVKNTERRRFPDGYERMLAVMEQAVKINVQKYMLSSSPNWISNKILKGMCHFLVNESKLRWVKK